MTGRSTAAEMLSQLAVIVPLGPGEQAWRALLPQLRALPAAAQLRLVGCESSDAPDDLPLMLQGLPADSQWLLAPRGRACQLNAGVAASSHPFLWFLHADSVLTPATLPALAQSLQTTPGALGYFDLRFHVDGPALMRINTFGAWLRSRFLGLPFGDQGLFLARADFERLGGFDESLRSAEDHALVWAARRAGVPLRAAGAPLYSSARRYAEHGWWRTTWKHLRLTWSQARAFSRTPQDPRV